jgi:hypothetical protein
LAGYSSKRLQSILDAESIEYDLKVIAELSQQTLSRLADRVLNECQRYSSGGEIDSALLQLFSDVKTNDLIKNLKDKNFTEVRKVGCVGNLDNDASSILRRVYDALLRLSRFAPNYSCCRS